MIKLNPVAKNPTNQEVFDNGKIIISGKIISGNSNKTGLGWIKDLYIFYKGFYYKVYEKYEWGKVYVSSPNEEAIQVSKDVVEIKCGIIDHFLNLK